MGYNMRILDSPVRRAMSSLTESITQSTQKRKTRQAKAAETSQSKCNDELLNEVGKVVGVVTELVETVSSEQSKRHKAEAQAQSLANDVEIMGGELDEIGKQRARNLRDETMATSRRDAAKLDLNNSSEFPEDGHLRRAKTKEVYEFLQEKCLPAKGHGGTMTASVSKAIAIIQGLVTTIIEAVGKDVIDVTRLMPTKDQERIETTELLIERIKSALHANGKSMSEEERQNIHVLLTYCAPEQVASGDQQGQAHKIANLLQVSEKPNSIWKQSIARRAEFDAAAAKGPAPMSLNDLVDCHGYGLGTIVRLEESGEATIDFGNFKRTFKSLGKS